MGIELDLQTAQYLKHLWAGQLLNCRGAIKKELQKNPDSKYLKIAYRDLTSMRDKLAGMVEKAEKQLK